MNRKKKINQTLQKRLKKQHAKLHPSNKPRYISKAERAKLAAEQEANPELGTSDAKPTQPSLSNSALQ
ncbi:DUF2986 domain-containing protein [Vibrio cholerae]|uniref:DUF2986 domain-containing protein n=1 Tax=Vibrio cholerae TaxID=666 RepID=UPI0002046BAA|nr:DUF2986 domain-containing protein [Vibrio cholerae]AEA78776.1 hypothetical protein VCLMA_A1564 [Vibrio cholerae LMA3984-4]EGQ8325341.1 DUF2986 domain-containing protein [Vibrio cholerae]EGR0612682.1 DUF2986 domain-containing protein [Vibrio cholerae]EGR4150660.1 DUF2986 domain-containing protein [Vibrio cholerae]EGR4195633.1 DUF2986 domain-containing protein [Vibrio cholerae]